jgi:hypothetical protein
MLTLIAVGSVFAVLAFRGAQAREIVSSLQQWLGSALRAAEDILGGPFRRLVSWLNTEQAVYPQKAVFGLAAFVIAAVLLATGYRITSETLALLLPFGGAAGLVAFALALLPALLGFLFHSLDGALRRWSLLATAAMLVGAQGFLAYLRTADIYLMNDLSAEAARGPAIVMAAVTVISSAAEFLAAYGAFVMAGPALARIAAVPLLAAVGLPLGLARFLRASEIDVHLGRLLTAIREAPAEMWGRFSGAAGAALGALRRWVQARRDRELARLDHQAQADQRRHKERMIEISRAYEMAALKESLETRRARERAEGSPIPRSRPASRPYRSNGWRSSSLGARGADSSEEVTQ